MDRSLFTSVCIYIYIYRSSGFIRYKYRELKKQGWLSTPTYRYYSGHLIPVLLHNTWDGDFIRNQVYTIFVFFLSSTVATV